MNLNYILNFFRSNSEKTLENSGLTAEEVLWRDTVLELLSRLDHASYFSVDSTRNVFVIWKKSMNDNWSEVQLALFSGYGMVSVLDAKSTVRFNVSFEHCPEAKQAREVLHLKHTTNVCERAIRFTEK